MKLDSLYKRLNAIEPEPVDISKLEQDRALFQAFVPCYIEHLQKLGVPDEIRSEMKAALATTGPRPFGHTRPDDRPYWCPLDDVAGNHWNKWGCRIKAAQFSAWADVHVNLGQSEEDVAEYRKTANDYLGYEVK
jgi:hypothetical protein